MPTPMERHYRLQQIAEMWGLAYTTTRDLFRDEPGIVVKPKGSRERREPGRAKRSYSVILIPESVLKRVHSRMVAH